jgi:N6-adenosine-specific RNA methylase IME4
MRRDVKLAANFLGSAKEIMGRYIELANITEEELNQIRDNLITSRPNRKQAVRLLAAKGFGSQEIAEFTGWDQRTIQRDLQELRATNVAKNATNVVGRNLPPADSTTDRAAKEERAAAVAEAAEAEGVTPEPTEKYRIIYADPPWSYGNTMPDGTTEPRDHYPVMELDAICAIPVKDWVEDNAVLFLWVTAPILNEAFEVVRAWGFEYKASFVWDKIKHNMGHYNSVRHEQLLICTRGSCQPDKQQLFDSVQSIERGKHSAKPVEFYDIIETLYTHGRKLEMFARAAREGWDVYGHQAELGETP